MTTSKFAALATVLCYLSSRASGESDEIQLGQKDDFTFRSLQDVSTCADFLACTGLAGDCCPTIDGVILDCCLKGPGRQCLKYPACAHLTGNCCPTDDEVFLNCCFEAPAPIVVVPPPEPAPAPAPVAPTPGATVPAPVPQPSSPGFLMSPKPTPPTLCADYPACVNLRGEPLAGDCCPHDGAFYVGCCFDSEPAFDIQPKEENIEVKEMEYSAKSNGPVANSNAGVQPAALSLVAAAIAAAVPQLLA